MYDILYRYNIDSIWEYIDSADTLKDAEYLKNEYIMAFNTNAIKIVKNNEANNETGS